MVGPHDIQHNGIQHNGTQNNDFKHSNNINCDTQLNDIQQDGTQSVMLSVIYAECNK